VVWEDGGGDSASYPINDVETVSLRLTAMCCAEGASVHLLRLSGIS